MEPDSPIKGSRQWLDGRLSPRGVRPRDAAFLIAGFWTVAIVVFGLVEWLIDPKTFHTFWLGIWWAIETVTTVGYGDVVPDQTAGKVIAAFLMLGGLSLLSVITAAITSGFVARAEAGRRGSEEDSLSEKLDQLAVELRALRTALEQGRNATGDQP